MEYTRKESIYPIILNQNNLVPSTNNNEYVFTFPQGSISFKDSRIALNKISLFYSWFNISVANRNNTFTIDHPEGAGTTTLNITVPDGFYSVDSLNSYIQSQLIANGLYLVDTAGDFVYYIELVTNPTYYAIQLNSYAIPTALPAGWTNPAAYTLPTLANQRPQLTVLANDFRDFLGFNAGTYPAAATGTDFTKLSDFTPQVSKVQSIIVQTDFLDNKFANPSSNLYSFSPSGVEFGANITSEPAEHSYIDIKDGDYTSLNIRLVTQDYRAIKLNDTNLIIEVLIKEIEHRPHEKHIRHY